MGTYISQWISRKVNENFWAQIVDNNICMFPTSRIHSHLCTSAGNITDCYNPSKLTIVIWLLMLSLYWFVPPGQWIICIVIFTPGIGYSAGDCVTTMLSYNLKKKKKSTECCKAKNWNENILKPVSRGSNCDVGWMRKGSNTTSSSVFQHCADRFISWGKLM